ncbi:MAG TPA: proteasome accessory factor PafA2 family protein, partial [Acidimicrobiales bacterium]
MAVPKIVGVETEFGIIVRGAVESNPIAASSVLINAYVHELARAGLGRRDQPKVGWDFEDEHPDIDARGFTAEGTMAPEVETHLVNAVLTNGARYYVDHAHPELSTPECADPRSIVVYDKAAELILQRSMQAAVELLPAGQEIVVYKNNSDRKGNSYGCHENYLMDRSVPFARVVSRVMPHFVTRLVYAG